MCLRYLYQAWHTQSLQSCVDTASLSSLCVRCAGAFLLLVVLKVLLGVGLCWYAARERQRDRQVETDQQRKVFITDLTSIERYKVHKGRII